MSEVVPNERLSPEQLLEWASDTNNPLFDYDRVPDHLISGAIALARELLALRSSVKTVPEALEQLRAAIKAADADKSRRNELLATLLVNIEKNEPTAEFAVALRDFVREERPKLSAIEAPSEGDAVAGKGEQRTLCDACGNSNLAHDRAVWTDDGSSFCPGCAPSPAASSEVTEEMVEQVRKLEEACNSARTALAGMTSVDGAIFKLDCRPLGLSDALTAALKGGK